MNSHLRLRHRKQCRIVASAAAVGILLSCYQATLAVSPPRSGEIEYEPAENEEIVPDHFRLEAHTFPFEQTFLPTVSQKVEISEVTFPSPVETPHAANNTVHCEYFRPLADGTHPGVVVLHILGGDFDLSRLICRQLSYNGVAALFVKLPYYGPRAEPGVEMISPDPYQTVRGMTQAVLDIRRAAAWLRGQDEIDDERLGITGVSLGGITSAVAATAEPRFRRIALMLAGGDIAQAGWESSELEDISQGWMQAGGTRESLLEIISPIDPVTYGENVRGREIIMFNAKSDELIPRACTEALWEAFGQPEIHWWAGGHYTAARFLFDGLGRAVEFFSAPVAE